MATVFSVSQLSQLAGVSVRTLHFYDKSGLLVPAKNPTNGYREYFEEHLVMLQQILIYRELDFSIEKIKSLFEESTDVLSMLEAQKDLLITQQNNLSTMIERIDDSMNILKGKKNYEILFKSIPKSKADRWKKMAKERVGKEEFEENLTHLAKLDETETSRFQAESEALYLEYADLMTFPPDDEAIQKLIKINIDQLNWFYTKMIPDFKGYSKKALLQTADVYENTPEVAESFEHYSEGMAKHFTSAMRIYAEANL